MLTCGSVPSTQRSSASWRREPTTDLPRRIIVLFHRRNLYEGVCSKREASSNAFV